eukprot:1206703-Karenia_brevis.AAC.1
MAKVPTWAWSCLQDIDDADGDQMRTVRNYEMHAVAFDNEAVCYKEEEEHVPECDLLGKILSSVEKPLLDHERGKIQAESAKRIKS